MNCIKITVKSKTKIYYQLLIIHYDIMWPALSSSSKYKNIQNILEVNCNIKFYKQKLDLIFI